MAGNERCRRLSKPAYTMRVEAPVVTRRRFSLSLASLAAGAAFGAPRLAGAHTSGREKIACPVDGTSFEVSVTMSYTTFGSYRDFQKKGAIGSLYEDMVHACPSCHFAGYQDDFKKPVDPGTKKWVFGDLRKVFGTRPLTEAEECEAAALRYAFEKAKQESIGNLWLVGSYLLRGAPPALVPKRKDYQRAAGAAFTAALAAGEIGDDGRGPVRYLVADLARRVGDFTAAIASYDAALAEPKQPSWLKTLCDEQKALALKNDANNDV
jgi:hypothetical protein